MLLRSILNRQVEELLRFRRVVWLFSIFIWLWFGHVQGETRPSVRIESNLVVIRVHVYNDQLMRRLTQQDDACIIAQSVLFRDLTSSEPYLPKDCESSEVEGLESNDFRVWEDGIQQQLQRVTSEFTATLTARDNLGFHNQWSNNPRGHWSSSDLQGHSAFIGGSAQKIYVITYVPRKERKGECHQIRVAVNRPHVLIFAPTEYCSEQAPLDPLEGTRLSNRLEQDLMSGKLGHITLLPQVGVFYSEQKVPRIEVALAFPWNSLKRNWSNGILRVNIGLLATIETATGRIIARFTDRGRPEDILFARGYKPYDPVPAAEPWYLPSRYEVQFPTPIGQYNIELLLDDGENFGKTGIPLNVKPYEGKELAISSVMLCKRFRDAHVAAVERAYVNFDPQYVPLVSKGIEFTPSGDTRFHKGEPLIAYFEMYEPLLKTNPDTKVEAHMKVFEAKTGKMIKDYPPVDATGYENAGSTTIPIARAIPFTEFAKGQYRLEVQATDSDGKSTEWQSADFTVE